MKEKKDRHQKYYLILLLFSMLIFPLTPQERVRFYLPSCILALVNAKQANVKHYICCLMFYLKKISVYNLHFFCVFKVMLPRDIGQKNLCLIIDIRVDN